MHRVPPAHPEVTPTLPVPHLARSVSRGTRVPKPARPPSAPPGRTLLVARTRVSVARRVARARPVLVRAPRVSQAIPVLEERILYALPIRTLAQVRQFARRAFRGHPAAPAQRHVPAVNLDIHVPVVESPRNALPVPIRQMDLRPARNVQAVLTATLAERIRARRAPKDINALLVLRDVASRKSVLRGSIPAAEGRRARHAHLESKATVRERRHARHVLQDATVHLLESLKNASLGLTQRRAWVRARNALLGCSATSLERPAAVTAPLGGSV